MYRILGTPNAMHYHDLETLPGAACYPKQLLVSKTKYHLYDYEEDE